MAIWMDVATWHRSFHSHDDSKNGRHGNSVVTKWKRRVEPTFVVMPLAHLVGPAPASLGALALGGSCAGIFQSPLAAHSPACVSHIHLPHYHQNGMELFRLHHFHCWLLLHIEWRGDWLR